jgi:hypothetical protein
MNAFVNAIDEQDARTENGMLARETTASATTDLFYKIGAMRGKNVIPAFTAAFVANPEHAVRIALWARDAREGAGERQLYRDILRYLERNQPDVAEKLIAKTPELGRWDDLLVFETDRLTSMAFAAIESALNAGNGLAAKWMPRKGPQAEALRKYLKLSPKAYRKLLVNLTKVVETQMCAKDWDNINFEHVPSVASARYRKAFAKNAATTYGAYLEALKNGTAKVNAGAVYPYDVLKTALQGDTSERQLILSQWAALPNYTDDTAILPLVDVSGSMTCQIAGSLRALDVAMSLGLYLAEKNRSAFKDCFVTFSATPQLLKLKGNVLEKLDQMHKSDWGMNTNLHAAFGKILDTAVKHTVPQSDMPAVLLILSDMQFDACVKHDDSAIEMIERKYQLAGYKLPSVVFWNLNDQDNVPVRFDKTNVALVSGFSPSIMKNVLKDTSSLTPEKIMLETILNTRYDY